MRQESAPLNLRHRGFALIMSAIKTVLIGLAFYFGR